MAAGAGIMYSTSIIPRPVRYRLLCSTIMHHSPLLTLALTSFALLTGLPNGSGRELTCAKGSVYYASMLIATRCCGGQFYRPGYQRALEENFDSCNKEPSDKTETLVDSQWTFYSCLMKRQLGEGQATFKFFAEAMAGNMTEPEKTKIMEIVKNSDLTRSNLDLSNKDQVQGAWTAYFDAEFEVCKDVLATPVQVNTTMARHRFWEPSFMCNGAKLPYIIPSKGNFMHRLQDCLEKMSQDMMLNGTGMREPAGICILIASGALKIEDLREERLDIDAIINEASPKTLSAQVKSEAMKNGKLALAKQYGGESSGTETLSEMAEKIAALGSQAMANVADSDKKLYSNMLALDAIVTALVGDGLIHNTCYPPRA